MYQIEGGIFMLKEKEKMIRYIDAVAPQMAAMSVDISTILSWG